MKGMRSLAVVVLALCALTPAPVRAWGFAAHRFIMEHAIDRLPDELRPFYAQSRTFLVEYSIMPDLLRNLDVPEEPPRHFIDMDAYGEYPFDALPHDYDAAVRKFGRDTIEKNGVLPWRVDEIFGRLVRAFERAGRGETYSLDDVRLMSATLAHYVADAHMPFHAVKNFDGQLTGQKGIHARFETELFERYQGRLVLPELTIPPIHDAKAFVFDAVAVGAGLTAPILDADRRAAAGRREYDDVYFDRFFAEVGPILERRVAESIAATAAVFAGAWERAGRPVLPLDPSRRPRKVSGGTR
jgi:hypothetical protein